MQAVINSYFKNSYLFIYRPFISKRFESTKTQYISLNALLILNTGRFLKLAYVLSLVAYYSSVKRAQGGWKEYRTSSLFTVIRL